MSENRSLGRRGQECADYIELHMLKGNPESQKQHSMYHILTDWKATEEGELFYFISGQEADNSKNALVDCTVRLGSLQG